VRASSLPSIALVAACPLAWQRPALALWLWRQRVAHASAALQRARPSASRAWPSAQRERLLGLLRLLWAVPEIAQPSAAAGHLRCLALLPPRGRCELGGRWLGSLWVRREPLRVWSSFFRVVGAQHAGDVRVVFRVAVCLAIEKLSPQVVVS
jgi:hypothetical protein